MTDFPNLDAIFDEKAINRATRNARISEALMGTKMSEEHRTKVAAANKARASRPMSVEHRAKIAASCMGRKMSDESKLKIAASSMGRKMSDESKLKMSAAALTRQRLTCPHCQKTVAANMMARWHGNNCKLVTK
jgi:ribosomal protein S27AE